MCTKEQIRLDLLRFEEIGNIILQNLHIFTNNRYKKNQKHQIIGGKKEIRNVNQDNTNGRVSFAPP